jgi:hypothetical protein
MAETRPPERLTASDLFSQVPQSGIPSKRTRTVMQLSVLIPIYGRSTRFRHQPDHLTAARTGSEPRDDQRWRWSSVGRAPRRNRTGDPILTMEPPGTAVRTAVTAGRALPSGAKLSALSPRSYAFSCVPGALST